MAASVVTAAQEQATLDAELPAERDQPLEGHSEEDPSGMVAPATPVPRASAAASASKRAHSDSDISDMEPADAMLDELAEVEDNNDEALLAIAKRLRFAQRK